MGLLMNNKQGKKGKGRIKALLKEKATKIFQCIAHRCEEITIQT